jgi:hypothetical protein
MDEQGQAVVVQRRRNQAEVEQVLAEYEASGLSRVAFCEQKGVSLATLARYRKRQAQCDAVSGRRWLSVEVSGGSAALETGASSGLTVTLAGGRRIEVRRGFDSRTLVELVGVLERI